MRVLFVAPRFPHPRLLGYQVRTHHQLRLLGRRHAITLVAFARDRVSPAALREIATCCTEVVTVPLRTGAMVAGVARGLLDGRPLQTALHDVRAMRRVVRRILAERRHDLVHVQLARMASYLEAGPPVPRVVDLVDALSLNMRRRRDRDRGPTRWAAGLEAARLGRYERALCRLFDHATVVSDQDRTAIGEFPNLTVNENAVDLERFPFVGEGRDPHGIVLSGNLGYFPNVDAAVWFAREVLPRVRCDVPAATLTLVGARPHRRVRRLAQAERGVVVAGPVAEMHPWLARSAVAVAPMRAGSGQPLKVLEAMASGTPVVATSLAIGGIAAVPGRHLLRADDPADFAVEVVRLLREPARGARLAAEARRLVEDRYGWERSVAGLDAVWTEVVARRTAVAVPPAAVRRASGA